ncbi:DNA circularization N-terminal domain-containing protein [Acinetobacter sp. V102_4]|uniref:DNA circularization N-terminal domain-containing protein n=1 Tax=Acinetobacter sp. V102_4 TaxID=3072984 RepID=UPI00287CDEDF|nr:DNA circularization N-terminal domain-containing protein [Acinetobacter sp. V102_4]MDS7929629.1 DNA circularization N-terminal domain-containing protein [Acinetobacter sp. V102_4]
MGWATDLQDASFRGVQFECTAAANTYTKSVAVKQSPYSDVASVEDMGNDPDDISLTAVFTGEDYKIDRDALITALKVTGVGELIHPIDGVMQVIVVNFGDSYDAENTDYCTLDMKFLRFKQEEKLLFVPVKTPTIIETAAIIDTPATKLQSFLEKLKLQDNDQLFATVTMIRDGLDQARSYLGLAKQTIEDILSPATYLVGLVDDVSKLVTFDTTITAISKWRDIVHRIQRFEKLFQNADIPEIKQVWHSTYVAAHIATAQQVILTVHQEMASDQMLSFTPVDLAVVRQNTRKILQQAIDIERESSSFESITQIQVYKALADQVHLQIQALIETRPPITSIQIPMACTVHWLAHYLYEDMSRSDEILRLNPDLINPARLLVGMELTVYAR